MLEVKKVEELIALNKALNYLRFQCREYESKYIAGSSIIKDLHLRIIDNLRIEYSTMNIEIPKDFGFIEDHKEFLETIACHIKNHENWTEIDENVRIEHIQNLVAPYRIKEKTIDDLKILSK